MLVDVNTNFGETIELCLHCCPFINSLIVFADQIPKPVPISHLSTGHQWMGTNCSRTRTTTRRWTHVFPSDHRSTSHRWMGANHSKARTTDRRRAHITHLIVSLSSNCIRGSTPATRAHLSTVHRRRGSRMTHILMITSLSTHKQPGHKCPSIVEPSTEGQQNDIQTDTYIFFTQAP